MIITILIIIMKFAMAIRVIIIMLITRAILIMTSIWLMMFRSATKKLGYFRPAAGNTASFNSGCRGTCCIRL